MISNSSPNTSLGREVFFNHYQEKSQVVKQAFQQFDQEVSLMDNRFGILETLSSHESNQVFTYNSNEHKFSGVPLHQNHFLFPISAHQRDAYTKDYLIHVLIPSLVKSILGENGKSDDKQALTEFIQSKLLD